MKNKFLALGVVLILLMTMSAAIFASTGKDTSTSEEIVGAEAVDNESEDQDLTNVSVAISEDQAKLAAIESVANGTFVNIGLEDENGTIVYGVEVNDGKDVHDIKVDANTGLILKEDIGKDTEETSKEDSDTEEDENSEELGEDEVIVDANVALAETEAIQIATDTLDAAAVFTKAELEDENGTLVYGVEFTLDKQELDVKVDANTGAVLASDQDDDKEDQDKESKSEDSDHDQIQHENDQEDGDGYED